MNMLLFEWWLMVDRRSWGRAIDEGVLIMNFKIQANARRALLSLANSSCSFFSLRPKTPMLLVIIFF